MKNFLSVFVILIIGHNAISQNCFPDSILLTCQEQINKFQLNYPGCNEVACNIWIEGADITNLNGLSIINCIEGNLCLKKNRSLNSLSGLGNLKHVENLIIKNNDLLVNLVGLESLDTINGTLKVWHNDLLKDLNGLNNISYIEHDLLIEGNYNLENCHGLEKLDSVGGSLVIGCVAGWMHHNRAIKSLSGFDNLTKIEEYLWINCNDSITNLQGLKKLHNVGKGVMINGNKCLRTLAGLESLTSCGGCLIIGGWGDCEGNHALTSLQGIENINPSSITELHIKNNQSLSYCKIENLCDYLSSPMSIVEISNNAMGCNSQKELQQVCSGAPLDDVSLIDQLLCFPNPCVRTMTIAYELCQPMEIKLSLFDNAGIEVFSFRKHQRQGKQEIVIDFQFLPSGLYNCEIIARDAVKNLKIIKL